MNIEISNEMIEKLVEKEVKAQVQKWFSKDENDGIIRYFLNKEVQGIAEKEISRHQIDIQKIGQSFVSEELFNKVAKRLSEDIADAHSDRFNC